MLSINDTLTFDQIMRIERDRMIYDREELYISKTISTSDNIESPTDDAPQWRSISTCQLLNMQITTVLDPSSDALRRRMLSMFKHRIILNEGVTPENNQIYTVSSYDKESRGDGLVTKQQSVGNMIQFLYTIFTYHCCAVKTKYFAMYSILENFLYTTTVAARMLFYSTVFVLLFSTVAVLSIFLVRCTLFTVLLLRKNIPNLFNLNKLSNIT